IKVEKCDIVYSNYDIIWSNGGLKRAHITGPLPKLLLGNIIGASFLYKKEVFQVIQGYNTELFLVEDFDFFLRASLKYKFYHKNENLYQYRIHEKSLTGKINQNTEYSIIHRVALERMYTDIGQQL